MEELLQAPTKGYGESIVIPEINADHFEIKTNLLQFVQANPYRGFERENPHTHINNFKMITLTLKFRDVPNDERFKEMLRACPHHGFTELAQIDTFYNGLNDNDQDSLNAAVGGNLLKTTDKEQTNFQGSTAHIQPPVTLISEPNVPKILPKPNIPYPSRLNDQKLHEKATNQMEKFFHIFQDLHFDISFAYALTLMPKFASTIKSLLTNKDKLFEFAKIPLNENCSAMLLKKLPVRDLGKFLIPCDFSGMDYVAREEYAQEILGFSKNSSGGNPTSTSEPILSDSSPSFTPFEGSDFILEEIEAYLKDESISLEIDHADCDPEGDICLIEKLLNNDLFQLLPIDLKQGEEIKAKASIEEPPELELKDLPSHLKYAYLEGGLAPWALTRDLEALRRHERIREAESETSKTEVALLGSEAKIGKIEREILHHDLSGV
nr:reverse transcriptase domain-containing protein [Tanacetum cinerariifolium]